MFKFQLKRIFSVSAETFIIQTLQFHWITFLNLLVISWPKSLYVSNLLGHPVGTSQYETLIVIFHPLCYDKCFPRRARKWGDAKTCTSKKPTWIKKKPRNATFFLIAKKNPFFTCRIHSVLYVSICGQILQKTLGAENYLYSL